MKIILAEYFGLCFGVRDAIAQAERLAEEGPLTVLGELVHNPIVRERLAAGGVRETSLNESAAPSRRVMITAHGASDTQRASWQARGYSVADGTCPLVRHAHDQLRKLVGTGFFPVVIGKSGHVEVNGLIGDFPQAIVIGVPADVARLPFRLRYGIISQTTQPIELVQSLVDLVRQTHPKSEVRFVDTVCRPTKDRQSALQRLIASVEVIVVVGGRASNNTRQLVESCRAAGRAVYHIERPEELCADWFHDIDTVGLTAGTSTLIETVEAVHLRLREMAKQ